MKDTRTWRARALVALLALILSLGGACLAETLTLPAGLRIIEAEAFMGDAGLERVVVPEGVTYIGPRAFSGCAGLTGVALPATVSEIAEDAFDGCGDLRAEAEPGTYAYAWCLAHGYIQRPDPSPAEDFTYEAIDDQSARITGYTGGDDTVVVPEAIDGYAIQAIGGSAFKGNQALRCVCLPDSVTTVGASAFRGCSALTGIDLGKGVETIESNAFQSCPALAVLTLPDGLNFIGNSAFSGCASLTEAPLPDSVTTINASAYENCANLRTFRYPLGLEAVGSDNTSRGYIFWNCEKLEGITVPEGVTAIPSDLFNGANYLKSVELPSTLKEIGTRAFRKCELLAAPALPDGLEFIGNEAFSGCASLTEALLPDSVTTINASAYENCANLKTFRYPMGLEAVGSDSLARGSIFWNCEKLERIAVPEGVTAIPSDLFNGANYLKYVDLPSTLKKIGARAFRKCESIATLALPDGLEFIGNEAFLGCSSLTEALLPDSVTTISMGAYQDCVSLETFHYPASLDTVRSDTLTQGYVFYNCEKLERIDVPAGETHIPAFLFKGANCVRYVDVPETVQSLGDNAFVGCTLLERVYLGYNVTSIGKKNFTSCPALTVWTEYQACAHQYAADNGVAFYYLTPDGVNIPSGVLYRGDDYPLYGYARSSVNLANVTAAILTGDGATTLQTVSVEPGVTDYSLASEFSAGLDFAALPLGTYRFTLRASTDISEELWADTSFRIVPPPLRVIRIGLDIPCGLYGEGDVIPVSGVIEANYPITRIVVGAFDDGGTATAQVYTGAPNRASFDLSEAGLTLAALPLGNYTFNVIVSGNGETVTAVCSDFTLSGAPAVDVSKVDRSALSAFLANDDNARPFANVSYYGSLEASLTPIEQLKYGMYTSDQRIRSGLIDLVQGGMGVSDSRRNEYLVTLYKQEITSYIKSHVTIIEGYQIQKLDKEKTITSLVSLHKADWGLIKEMLGPAASEFEKEYVDAVNFDLKAVDWAITSILQIRDLANYFYDALMDYTQGIQTLDTLAAQVLDPTSWNYNYQLAVRELKEEYTSNSVRLWHNLFKYAKDACAKEGHNRIVEKVLTGLVSKDFFLAYKITKAAWNIYAEETGFYDDVAKLDKYHAQCQTFTVAYQNYTECFRTLKNGGGDDTTIARLIHTFELTKSTGIRSIATLRTLPMRTRFVSDGELSRLSLEFSKKHCP